MPVIQVGVKAVVPAKEHGCAVFVGNDEKVFIIYVDAGLGVAISMFMQKAAKERPLTHDLIGHIFTALEVKLERVIINNVQDGTFFARIILRVSNEVQQKVIEIDARPSDSLALAIQADAPIFCAQTVWDAVEDASQLLESINEQIQDKPDP